VFIWEKRSRQRERLDTASGGWRPKVVTNYYTLTYDAENQLTSVSGGASASFVYDGDGNRVKATLGSTIAYVGDYFEWKGSTSTMVKYYYAGGQRIAMRVGSSIRYYLLTDHLGSTAITAYSSGGKKAELRYKAWGETRYTYGTTPTTYRFTGQRLDESTGLYYYGARYYDPALGRFVQADTIVPEPGNPQALNRYSYVYNNPLRYIDPTGHEALWHRIRRRFHWATAPWQPWYNLPLTVCGSMGCASVSMRSINNYFGDQAIRGLDAEIERAAQDARVPTILLAAALHHQGGSPKVMDMIADLGLKSPENVSRGIGQITIDEAKEYNRLGLVLDPVPDETLAEALYIPEVSVRYMAAKLKESSLLIDENLRKPQYSTISLSDQNRWLLLMAAQNAGRGAVDYFFENCEGCWQCWFNDWSMYHQVLYMRDDIAWLVEEGGWTDDR
jgi:RHS repeat-associated protein